MGLTPPEDKTIVRSSFECLLCRRFIIWHLLDFNIPDDSPSCSITRVNTHARGAVAPWSGSKPAQVCGTCSKVKASFTSIFSLITRTNARTADVHLSTSRIGHLQSWLQLHGLVASKSTAKRSVSNGVVVDRLPKRNQWKLTLKLRRSDMCSDLLYC